MVLGRKMFLGTCQRSFEIKNENEKHFASVKFVVFQNAIRVYKPRSKFCSNLVTCYSAIRYGKTCFIVLVLGRKMFLVMYQRSFEIKNENEKHFVSVKFVVFQNAIRVYKP